MIHALLYTAGIKENHGPNFRRIMRNINKVAGTNITVSYRTIYFNVETKLIISFDSGLP